MTLFGFRGAGVGLAGTFYDFKRDTTGKPTGLQKLDRPNYTAILHGFVNGSTWAPPGRFRHHTSSAKLGAKVIFLPVMPDTEASVAFQDPDAGAGLWLAHYSGTVASNVSGEYRFVGFSDNVLIAGIGGRVMLDGLDVGYLHVPRTNVGAVTFPRYGGKPTKDMGCLETTDECFRYLSHPFVHVRSLCRVYKLRNRLAK